MWKVCYESDGTVYTADQVFDSEKKAREYACYLMTNFRYVSRAWVQTTPKEPWQELERNPT